MGDSTLAFDHPGGIDAEVRLRHLSHLWELHGDQIKDCRASTLIQPTLRLEPGDIHADLFGSHLPFQWYGDSAAVAAGQF